MTPVASEIEIKSTSPFGSIPRSAAADDTTASRMGACRSRKASKNRITPNGTISILVNRVTLFIEPSSSDATRFSFFTSLASFVA